MKKLLFFLGVFLSIQNINAQSIGIGTASPNASAQLDVSSTNKGLLVPRLTTAQRTAIASPAAGLMVYETNSNSFWFYNGTAWGQIGSAGGNTWTVSGNNIYSANSGNVGIGTTAPTSKFHLGGSMLINSTDPIIQFQQSGVQKGYMQLSGNDLRMGTNSGNSNGSLIFRMDGTDRIFTDSIGQMGIGKSVPRDKLDVDGNILLSSSSVLRNPSLKLYANPAYEFNSYGPATVGFYNWQSAGAGNYDYNRKFEIEFEGGTSEKLKLHHVDYSSQLVLSKTGMVGIGMTPAEDFDVRGTVRIGDVLPHLKLQATTVAATSSGMISFNKSTGVNSARIGSVGSRLKLSGRETTSQIDINDDLVLYNGNTGISTDNPLTKLHIENGEDAGLSSSNNGYVMIGPSTGTNIVIDNNEIVARSGYTTASDLYLQNDGGEIISGARLTINKGGEAVKLNGADPAINLYVNGVQKSYIWQTGNNLNIGVSSAAGKIVVNTNQMQIGTSAALPAEYKLGVGGKVICEELKVKLQTSGWPDYVFADDYKLASLKDVEKFIQENKHLPNIPAASEVEKNGLEVGDMQTRMMQKIEELTLYIIELQKQVDVLKTDKNNK